MESNHRPLVYKTTALRPLSYTPILYECLSYTRLQASFRITPVLNSPRSMRFIHTELIFTTIPLGICIDIEGFNLGRTHYHNKFNYRLFIKLHLTTAAYTLLSLILQYSPPWGVFSFLSKILGFVAPFIFKLFVRYL